MTKLRFWFLVFIVWLVFLFNVERLMKPVDISKYTYVAIAVVALVVMLYPGSRRIPFWVLVGVPSVFLVAMQILMREPVFGASLPVTITEICSVVLTGLFARELNRHFSEFEEAVSRIVLNYAGTPPPPFAEEQGVMYQELKRARLYKRPLSVLVIKPHPNSLQQQLPQILQTYRDGLVNHIAIAGITRLLDRELFETDVIAHYRDSLVVMLPELDAAHVDKVISKIQQVVKQQMALDLDIGVAAYPNDANTFENLLNTARQRADAMPAEAEETSSPAPVVQPT